MRLREAAASALQLLVILTYFGMACLALILASRPDWRAMGIEALQTESEIFYWIGAGIALYGFLLVMGFYGIGRGRFLRLLMKPHLATVDVKLIEKAMEECFRAHFASHVRGADIVVISKQRLEVAVDLVPLEERLQLRMMNEMEKKLGVILRDRFGYERSFTLSVHSR